MAQYNLGTAHGSVQIDADTSGITAAQRALNQLNQQSNTTGGGLGNLGNQGKTATRSLGVVASTVAVMATKLAIATAVGAGLVAIAAELSGVLGLLPAVAVAGGLAMGALKIGMSGFGDAMKNAGDPEAFAESLKSLSPEARQTAIALRGLRDEWKDLKTEVQDALFKGTAESIQGLSATYLPMLQDSLSRVARHFNAAFGEVATQLQSTGRQADMRAIFQGNEAVVGNLVRAIVPLVGVFIDVAAVATPILQRITSGAEGATTRFAAFVAEARKTGELQAWIERGLQAFQDLWNIISLLFGTVTNLVAAFGGPDSLLGVLTMVATALNVVSQFINENRAVLGPLMLAIGGIVALYKIWTIATTVWAAVTAAQTAIANSAFLGTIATSTMAALRWIGNFLLMSAAAVAWVAVQIVQFAIASAQWIAMAALATARAIVIGAAWLLTAGASAAVAVAQTIAAAVVILAQWALMGIQAMARAVVMAAAWFIALGPIGWAIAALLAVVAFVIIFWDDVVAFFKAGAEKVSQWMQSAWQWVVDKWNAIKNAFTQAGQAIWQAVLQAVAWLTNVWNQGMAFLASLPGRILGVFAAAGQWLINAGRNIINGLVNGISAIIGSVGQAAGNAGRAAINAFSGAASWLVGAGMDLLRGLWNGISRMGSWVYNQVMGWARGLLNGVKSFFGISSPSKVFEDYGNWLMEGMGIGIEDSAAKAVNAAEVAANSILDTMTGMLDTGTIEAIIGDSLSDASLAALVTGAPVAGGTAATAAATGAGSVAAISPAQALAPVGAGAGGPTVHMELNTYNPVAEKASDTEARRIRAAAAVGSF